MCLFFCLLNEERNLQPLFECSSWCNKHKVGAYVAKCEQRLEEWRNVARVIENMIIKEQRCQLCGIQPKAYGCSAV